MAPAEIVERLRVHIDAVGLVAACAALDCSRETALRILSGLGVRRGSVATIEAAFARRDHEARARGEDGST